MKVIKLLHNILTIFILGFLLRMVIYNADEIISIFGLLISSIILEFYSNIYLLDTNISQNFKYSEVKNESISDLINKYESPSENKEKDFSDKNYYEDNNDKDYDPSYPLPNGKLWSTHTLTEKDLSYFNSKSLENHPPQIKYLLWKENNNKYEYFRWAEILTSENKSNFPDKFNDFYLKFGVHYDCYNDSDWVTHKAKINLCWSGGRDLKNAIIKLPDPMRTDFKQFLMNETRNNPIYPKNVPNKYNPGYKPNIS